LAAACPRAFPHLKMLHGVSLRRAVVAVDAACRAGALVEDMSGGADRNGWPCFVLLVPGLLGRPATEP